MVIAYDGSGYLVWEGLVCLQQTGKCTDAHRELGRNWLEKKNLADIQVTELFDVW